MSDQEFIPKAAPRVPRWIKVLLGLSLALNMIVVGIVVGAATRSSGPMRAGPGMSNYAMPYVIALPREDRKAIFRSLRAEEGRGMPDHSARRALYNDMVIALEAIPFEMDAVEQIVKAQGAAGVSLQQAAQAAWLERVSQMDAKTRADYAKRVQDAVQRRQKKRKPQKQN